MDSDQLTKHQKVIEDPAMLLHEQTKIIEQWNSNDVDYPAWKTLHQIFQEVTKNAEDKVAVICENRQLTYKELDERSNYLAFRIQKTADIQPNELVALCLDKSELTIIAILAVWKSGAAFVPIDPCFPDEQIKFILDDSSAKMIIANHHHASRMNQFTNVNIFEVESVATIETLETPKLMGTSSDLAYVTYTSGTTGKPKGVMKEHKSVVNSIVDLSRRYKIREGPETIALFSAYVFEPFLRQMLMALLNCQTLVIVKEEVKQDPMEFSQILKEYAITYLNGTPSLLQQYDYSSCPKLAKILLAGEELTRVCFENIRKTFRGTLITEYGPTEAAFVTTLKEYGPLYERLDRSIGKPLANVKCYVLDSHLQQVEIGEVGELFISGAGVSRGYLNRPDLTAGSFLVNPFQGEADKLEGKYARIYKTGDSARWLQNGELEFLGRKDTQVKINGVRIELSGIEHTLCAYPGVKHCAVVAKDANGGKNSKRLIGYYVPNEGMDNLIESDLLSFLQAKVPKYMIPQRLIRIENIPVTRNGKLDIKALPDPDFSDATRKVNPCNELEQDLCQIWSETLDIPLEWIGVTDDFIQLGGDSISSIQLVGRIRKQIGVIVSPTNIFSLKTIQNLVKSLTNEGAKNGYQLRMENGEHVQAPGNPQAKPCTEELGNGAMLQYPANGLQQSFMHHYLKQSVVDDAYIVQCVYQYKTDIDVRKLRQAWELALKKYPSLRSRFVASDKGVFQVIDQAGHQSLDWRLIDMSTSGCSEQEVHIKHLLASDRKERYHLEEGNLFRVYLAKHSTCSFTLIFSYHHIILDGWSVQLLLDYVHDSYLKLVRNEIITTEQDDAFEAAKIYFQQHQMDSIDYWPQKLNQISERCDLNGLLKETCKYKVVLGDYDCVEKKQEQSLVISGELHCKIKELCRTNGVTLHSVLQFAWHKLLCAYGNSNHTVTGTVVSGRTIPIYKVEDSVGLFINTLPLVVDHEQLRGESVINAIKSVQTQVNAMNDRCQTELAKLDIGEMKRHLFDCIFMMENYLNKARNQAQNEILRFEENYSVEKLDYPLAVIVREKSECIHFAIWYADELFENDAIAQLLNIMEGLLQQVVDDANQQTDAIEFLTPLQKATLNEWNEKTTEFPSEKTLHSIFEEMVGNFPKKVSLIYEGTKLTYEELNEKSNQLAHYLRSITNIKPDTLIAVCMDKSELMIISIIGIWKSGAAYVPLDPSYGDERIRFICEDTKSQVLFTNRQHAPRLRQLFGGLLEVLDMEDISVRPYSAAWSKNPTPISRSTDLAYVIYTSGTTGNPKGVMVEHIGVVNLQNSLAKIFALRNGTDEALLSFSNFVFDHFVEQMTDALLNGQTLVILNDEMRVDKHRLYQYMAASKVTYLSGTPSVLQLYEYDGFDHSITRIDAIGEDFTETAFNKIRSTFHGLIINGYGPTEISITSHKRLYRINEKRTNKSIGIPIANTTCYILNWDMKRVPIGGVGELYIGGVGVARGYLNRPELTADRFLANPYQTKQEKAQCQNGRIYKTGDLVRWLTNGEIEYLGRNDFQVKIRGLRVELGEIESVMSSFPGIKQAVVVAKDYATRKENGGSLESRKRLIAYYVSGEAVQESDIIRFMKMKLPEYMIPSRFVHIDKVPVTISGKLDTKRLQAVECPNGTNCRIAPTDPIQTKLCHLWSEVLGIPAENISIIDDFFALGGDSLLAQTLFFKISDAFSSGIPVAVIFQHKTIQAMADYIRSAQNDTLQENDILEHSQRNNHQDVRVSFAQECLLFIHEFEGGSHAYNISINVKVPASIDKEILKNSLLSVILRHQVLRTVIIWSRPEAIHLQRVMNEEQTKAKFVVKEASVMGNDQVDGELIKAAKHVFHLESELPIKVTFLNNAASKNSYIVGIVLHHVCFDGLSWRIFQRDLAAFYHMHSCDGQVTGPNAILPALKVQYNDFAIWQRAIWNNAKLHSLLEFWKKKLCGYNTLNLPTDFPRPAQFDYSGKEVDFELDYETTSGLKRLATELDVSVFSVLVSAYCFVLSIYSNQRDIMIGTPVANRNHPKLENTIGLFVNMIVLRVDVDQKASVVDYIKAVSEEVIQALEHQQMPFEKLVKELKLSKDLSRHPLVQVIFSFSPFEGISGQSDDPLSHLGMSNYLPANHDSKTAKYDLSTTISKCDVRIEGQVNFCTSLFHNTTAKGITESFTHTLKQFSGIKKESETTLAKIECTADTNGEEQLQAQMAQTLHQIFEADVERSMGKPAIVHNQAILTYGQLNQMSNQLAHYLLQLGLLKQSDSIVALYMDKSELTVMSIIGVWKAGAAYVPIDPSYPSDRVQHILQETKTNIIITNQKYSSKITELSKESAVIIQIDNPAMADVLLTSPTNNPKAQASGNNLAYVIYTSGTTGRPKGVMIEHKGVVNLRNSLIQRYFGDQRGNFRQQEGILFLSNYAFDFSLEQLILSVLSSNKLVIVPSEFEDGDQLYDYLNYNGLTYLSGTPAQLQQMDLTKLQYLRNVTVAGDFVTEKFYKKIRKEFKGILNNAYGTTETSVYNTVRRFQQDDDYKNSLGDLLPNMKKFMLNESLRLIPSGAIGELYLAGNCVARGYLDQPGLTAERFIPNPFQTDHEKETGQYGILYKTGDLVRLRPDGELEYLGRKDGQVKIRGFRIELGEIETVLSSFPSISQCAVLAISGNDYPQLVGYFVTEGNYPVSRDEIRSSMQAKLPTYMIPTKLVQVDDSLPMTPNGKLDTAALTKLDSSADRKEYTAPETELESSICQIWSDVLRIENCSVDDDFFELGGDSILSQQLASRIRHDLNAPISVKDIFMFRSVRSLVNNILDKSEKQCVEVKECRAEQGILSGSLPLLPIQKWFFRKNLKNFNHWNQSFTIRTPSLDLHKLQDSLLKLFEHHDAFRLRFKKETCSYIQYYEDQASLPLLQTIDIQNVENLRKFQSQLQKTLDVENGPMFCVAYLHGYEDGTGRLWFVLHHLITDTVSWRIISQDLQTIYNGGKLERKGSSYRQCAQAIEQYGQNARNEQDFWRTVLDNSQQFRRKLTSSVVGGTHQKETFHLSQKETEELLRRCNRAYGTQINDLLLTALAYALCAITGGDTCYVTLEGHGREISDSLDVSRTIGWFTVMYPVELKISGDLRNTINGIKYLREAIPNKGIGYGAIIGYDKTLPPVSFNYLGQFETSSAKPWTFEDITAIDDDDRSPQSIEADNDVISVTGFMSKNEMRFNLVSCLGARKTDQFSAVFKSKLTEIIEGAHEGLQLHNDLESNFEAYVEFYSSADGPAIFVLPPGEGGAESYFNNIVRKLSGFKLFLFNNYYLHMKKPLTSFEELAQFYISYMKRIQHHGPYHLIGWSFGGILALEISRQLGESGDAIGNIVIIDSYFNVQKASYEIGHNNGYVIDRINYQYPKVNKKDRFRKVAAVAKHIVLFKAALLNDSYKSAEEKRLYEYYMNAPYNNLDTLIDQTSIRLVLMEQSTHLSWVNEKELTGVCDYIRSLF